jgi:hypothetical protein
MVDQEPEMRCLQKDIGGRGTEILGPVYSFNKSSAGSKLF